MALGSGRRIVVEFIGDASALRKATKDGEAALQGFSGKAQAAGRIAGKVLAGGLLLAGAAAVSATKAAAEDEAAQSQLAQQLKQAAGASDKQVAATEAWIAAQGEATGMTDDELRPALARLATATGDVDEATRLAALALDTAAGSQKSYQQVTEAFAKAANGNVGALGRLGIATKDAEGKTKSFAQIQQDLASKHMGAAAKAAETAAGKQKILTTQFSELQEQIGAKLLPVMVKLGEIGLKVVSWISQNTRVVGIFMAALGALLAVTWAVGTATKAAAAAQSVWAAATAVSAAVSKAMNSTFVLRLQLMALDAAAWVKSTAMKVADTVATVAHTVATNAAAVASKAMAAAQWLVNAAMLANPVGLVVLAIAALVAGLIIAYKKSETFRNIVNAAFESVSMQVSAVVGFIKNHWQKMLIILTGPIGLAVALIVRYWDQIRVGVSLLKDVIAEKFGAAKDAIVSRIQAAREKVDATWDAMKIGFSIVKDRLTEIAGNIKDSISNAFNHMLGPIKAVIDQIQWLIDKIKSIPTPDIPGMRVSVGSSGGSGSASAISRTPMARAVIGGSGGGVGGGNVYVTVNMGVVTDPVAAGREMVKAFRQLERATGRQFLVSAG